MSCALWSHVKVLYFAQLKGLTRRKIASANPNLWGCYNSRRHHYPKVRPFKVHNRGQNMAQFSESRRSNRRRKMGRYLQPQRLGQRQDRISNYRLTVSRKEPWGRKRPRCEKIHGQIRRRLERKEQANQSRWSDNRPLPKQDQRRFIMARKS